MAGVRTRKKSVWIAFEPSYSVEPDATGAAFLHIPAFSIGELTDGKALLETNFMRGQNWKTALIEGKDGWSLDMEIPLLGLSAGQTGIASALADDFLDVILRHTMGIQEFTTGEVVSLTAGTTLDLATDVLSIQDFAPMFQTGVPAAAPGDRVFWPHILTDNADSTYVMSNTPPGVFSGGQLYGVKRYRFSDTGGPSVAIVFHEDDEGYGLFGGRCTSFGLTGEAGEKAMLALTFEGDRQANESVSARASLPLASTQPATTPLKALLSCVEYENIGYDSRIINVDLGINAAEQMSTKGANGRSDFDLIGQEPVITVEPLRTNDIQDLKRNAEAHTGRLSLIYGTGAVVAGVVNSVGIHVESAQVVDAPRSDDGGRLRNTLTFNPVDSGIFPASTVESYKFQICRG